MKRILTDVLRQIQVDSRLDCPPLKGGTKPVEHLPGFDSKVWPVATTIFASEVGMTIPNDVNIFFDESTKLARSIDEIVSFLSELQSKQHEQRQP